MSRYDGSCPVLYRSVERFHPTPAVIPPQFPRQPGEPRDQRLAGEAGQLPRFAAVVCGTQSMGTQALRNVHERLQMVGTALQNLFVCEIIVRCWKGGCGWCRALLPWLAAPTQTLPTPSFRRPASAPATASLPPPTRQYSRSLIKQFPPNIRCTGQNNSPLRIKL